MRIFQPYFLVGFLIVDTVFATIWSFSIPSKLTTAKFMPFTNTHCSSAYRVQKKLKLLYKREEVIPRTLMSELTNQEQPSINTRSSKDACFSDISRIQSTNIEFYFLKNDKLKNKNNHYKTHHKILHLIGISFIIFFTKK